MTRAERTMVRRLQGDRRAAWMALFRISAKASEQIERCVDVRVRAALVSIQGVAEKGQARLMRTMERS